MLARAKSDWVVVDAVQRTVRRSRERESIAAKFTVNAVTMTTGPKTVLLSAEEYQRPQRRDRRVLATTDLTGRQIAALQEAKVPDEYAYIDAEFDGWNR